MVKLIGTKNKILPEYFSRRKLSPGGSLCVGSLVLSVAPFRKGVTQASGAFGRCGGWVGGGYPVSCADLEKRHLQRLLSLPGEALMAAGPPLPSPGPPWPPLPL